MDIEGLKKLVNDWYSKQGVTDGIRVIITVDIKGCDTTTEPAKVLTMENFLTKKFFEPIGINGRPGSLSRLRHFVMCNDQLQLPVSEFVSLPNIYRELERFPNTGRVSIRVLNDALIFHGFRTIARIP